MGTNNGHWVINRRPTSHNFRTVKSQLAGIELPVVIIYYITISWHIISEEISNSANIFYENNRESCKKSWGLMIINLKKLPGLFIAFLNDFLKWAHHSLVLSSNNTPGKQKAILLMNLHSIEKGLSFKNIQKGFGRQKVLNLLKQTENYLNHNKTDSLGLASLGVLNQYIQNAQFVRDDYIIDNVRSLTKKYCENCGSLTGGTKCISHEALYNDFDYSQLYNFVATRHSVRNFSEKEITQEQILQAVTFAQTAPSVCNRQTARVHVFSKNSFGDIMNAQLGDQGWVNNANKLFIITTDLNYFGGIFERQQAYIDGGLFCMQFVTGLHAQKIASCCKMYIRSPLNDKKIYKATGIHKNEIPIMLILAGHYEAEITKVPYSFRFPATDILNIH